MAINAVILDSGAITALGNNNEAIRVALKKAAKEGANIYVPTVTIAESTSGTPRDANVNRVIKSMLRSDCNEEVARAAAALRYSVGANKAGIVDAIVIATADQHRGSIVLTSDIDDLRPLSQVQMISHVVNISNL